ncbi:2'-5' RNA ligase family protein [Alteribacillus sp. YIM 98480]|uniref:2'-5' RNA ligase family protein n=1 Tax=Alteribacillus sp. YIM 98480 TaxID=2606599 RepID=UPI00131AD91B|nr:2'-5' RNA ligase family protein [Alteribacillus sp. YIM 98480]
MKYGLACFPSKQIQDMANNYRKRYDTHYLWIPPHVTLKPPYELKEDQLEQEMQRIQTISSKTPPFPLTIYKADTFYPKENKIFFKIKPNDILLSLYEALNEQQNSKEKEEFTPHLTIGQDLTNDEHFDVVDQLKMKDIHHEEIIDQIQLLYQLEDKCWTVYETFHLGKEE